MRTECVAFKSKVWHLNSSRYLMIFMAKAPATNLEPVGAASRATAAETSANARAAASQSKQIDKMWNLQLDYGMINSNSNHQQKSYAQTSCCQMLSMLFSSASLCLMHCGQVCCPTPPGPSHQWWKCHWSWRNPRYIPTSSKRPQLTDHSIYLVAHGCVQEHFPLYY